MTPAEPGEAAHRRSRRHTGAPGDWWAEYAFTHLNDSLHCLQALGGTFGRPLICGLLSAVNGSEADTP